MILERITNKNIISFKVSSAFGCVTEAAAASPPMESQPGSEIAVASAVPARLHKSSEACPTIALSVKRPVCEATGVAAQDSV